MSIVAGFVVWILLCLLVDKYATKKGHSWFFVWAFLFSPVIAFLVAALLPTKDVQEDEVVIGMPVIVTGPQMKCPHCAAPLASGTNSCRSCRKKVSTSKSAVRREPGYFYASGETAEGPFTADEIREFLDAGIITADTPVAREGESEWGTAGSLALVS